MSLYRYLGRSEVSDPAAIRDPKTGHSWLYSLVELVLEGRYESALPDDNVNIGELLEQRLDITSAEARYWQALAEVNERFRDEIAYEFPGDQH